MIIKLKVAVTVSQAQSQSGCCANVAIYASATLPSAESVTMLVARLACILSKIRPSYYTSFIPKFEIHFSFHFVMSFYRCIFNFKKDDGVYRCRYFLKIERMNFSHGKVRKIGIVYACSPTNSTGSVDFI